MKVKLLFVLLAVVCLTVGVGIGVHLMHKDALADVDYKINVYMWDDQAEAWAVWGDFTVNFDFGGAIGDFDEDTSPITGQATHTLDDWNGQSWFASIPGMAGQWMVWDGPDRLGEGDWPPVEIWGTVNTHLFWLEPVNGR